MTVTATVTTKGQITLPVSIRKALGIGKGDRLTFALKDNKVEIERVPNFLDLAGSIPVPPELRGLPWEEVRRRTYEARAQEWVEQNGVVP
ncbi:MAG: type II toxin-antitoxin system PrlF family antitoxin [Promicromonosporaceae bacterium]|nr:type II toxin-antitoxin system PrlF family antitoxin [Promicromonosporaceae bacterium]